MDATFVSFGAVPAARISVPSSSQSLCPTAVRPSRQFAPGRICFSVRAEAAETKAKTPELEVSQIVFKAEAEPEPEASSSTSTAKASEPAGPAWQVPSELRTFGGGNTRTTARSGYTTDRESGMMNSWAIEPKMYVAEDGVSDSVKGILKVFSQIFGGAVAEDKQKRKQ